MALVPVLTNKDIQEIGHRIECCRKSVGLSKQEMADNIGLGYEQYRRIESGKVLIKTEYLYTIACMLRVSVDYLLYGTENWSGSQKLKEILNDNAFLQDEIHQLPNKDSGRIEEKNEEKETDEEDMGSPVDGDCI